MYAPLHAFQYFHGIFIGVRCHSDICRPRVLGIPIPKALVMWVSPLTLTQIAKVVWEGDACIDRVLGMGMPKTRGWPYHCHTGGTPLILLWGVRLGLRDSGPVPHKINKFATLLTDNKIGILSLWPTSVFSRRSHDRTKTAVRGRLGAKNTLQCFVHVSNCCCWPVVVVKDGT